MSLKCKQKGKVITVNLDCSSGVECVLKSLGRTGSNPQHNQMKKNKKKSKTKQTH